MKKNIILSLLILILCTLTNGFSSELNLNQKLRARIMREEALSENAKKVGIVVTDDAIILSGTVANRAEKVTLENLARSMAGKKKVYNRLSY